MFPLQLNNIYIQLTNKCNLECEHCCYSCSPRNKDFISMETYNKIKEIFLKDNYENYITIGGGEPTLHKDFFFFIIDLLSLDNQNYVYIATNGTIYDKTKRLINLAKKELLTVGISTDYFHKSVEKEVLNYYITSSKESKYVLLLDHSNRDVINIGRAKRLKIGTINKCVCEDTILIDPLGNLYSCGCKTLKIGNINTGFNNDIILKIKEYMELNNLTEIPCYTHDKPFKKFMKSTRR